MSIYNLPPFWILFSYSGGIFRCSGGIFRCSGGIPVVGVLLHAQKRDMRAAKQARQFRHAMQILNHYQYSFLYKLFSRCTKTEIFA
jgi:hypothetical protein